MDETRDDLTPAEELAVLWPSMDAQQRDIVLLALALAQTLEDAETGWQSWVLEIIERRVSEARGRRLWEVLMQSWEDI